MIDETRKGIRIMEAVQAIQQLKKERNALILAHFYQLSEIQDIADVVGDSLELAKAARDAKEDVIVFCGVRFMAETAKILSPNKTVLLPALDAGCPMADMITAEEVLRLREAHPNAAVMCYVNSDVAVKAVSDICCTSANALKIAMSLEEEEIIFVPDQCLGGYIAQFVPQKRFILAEGFCPTHCRIKPEDVIAARKILPNAKVLVHPECLPDVVSLSDFAGSTSQIIAEAMRSDAKEFLIGTEEGVLHRLNSLCPDKKFYNTGRTQVCPNMKKTRLADVVSALERMQHEITVEEPLAQQALKSLNRMFSVPV